MVVDGGGHFSPAGIDGVHTCLYYYRPLQYMTVPRIIQLYNITPETTENQRTLENYRKRVQQYMTKPGECELHSPVSNA